MTQRIESSQTMTIGLDTGDRTTHACVLDGEREVVHRSRFSTSREPLARALARWPGARVVLEAGSQSPWMAGFLRERGFRVQVVDPRRVALIAKDPRKTDKRDAEMLARLGSAVPELLGSVHHRSEQTQADLSAVRARALLVRLRTQGIQQVRGILKAFGVRVPGTSSEAFHKKAAAHVPTMLQPALQPVLRMLGDLAEHIASLDATLEQLAKDRYPEIQLLSQVNGVGPVTSVSYVLTIEDPSRFARSRQVGSWTGLCPRSRASGDKDPQLGIAKTGDPYLRRLLVQCAQYILGPFGKDSDLRRFGQRLVDRGGGRAKARAVVAVARKLAVLLHRLWATGEVYEPLRQAERRAAAAQSSVVPA
jgi:transposase